MCGPETSWAQIVQWQTGQGEIASGSRTDRMMIIEQEWTDVHKGRYNGKCAKVDMVANA